MQKKDKSCGVRDVKQLQSVLKCHIDFLLFSKVLSFKR